MILYTWLEYMIMCVNDYVQLTPKCQPIHGYMYKLAPIVLHVPPVFINYRQL